jgi:hypothetical protein
MGGAHKIIPAGIWRVLAKAHDRRNLAEYEGRSEVDERLLRDLIDCAAMLEKAVRKLGPPKPRPFVLAKMGTGGCFVVSFRRHCRAEARDPATHEESPRAMTMIVGAAPHHGGAGHARA